MNKNRIAFTLSEILITLGIIGVVAALTMPTLIQKQQELSRVTALKKVYSVLSNAYNLAINENGGSNDFGYLPEDSAASTNSDTLYLALKPYLKILKECEHGQEGCFPANFYVPSGSASLNLITAQNSRRKFVILQDGTSVGFMQGVIYVDINGLKKPNVAGEDVFQFSSGTNTLKSAGTNNDSCNCYTNSLCCSAWVITNGNQDYLHCDDLSWDGKSKCD